MVKYELLSPAGNFSMLHSAIKAGCDAVYFGISGFNMREGAKNFTISDLPKIKKICSLHNKKVKMYLTLNTIIYDSELNKIENIIKKAKSFIDAIICWDNSIIQLCNKYKVPFHISTQASISNSQSAEFYKKLGAKRVVLARELNLKQIKKISKVIECECFCHGAMCVAVSGRCFTSQFLQNLSANRGQCSHPCRREWTITDDSNNQLKLQNNKVMSAKDLCTLPFVEKMKQAGITSFKIEGRNKSPEYVYTVTKVYRQALDKKLTNKEINELLNELNKVYNRGFSSGFYIKMPTNDDFSYSNNGEQTEYKEYIGTIEKYWPKSLAASLKLHYGNLKLNDEIYILSDKQSIQRLKVKSMQVNNKEIKQAKKGQEIGIKLPKCFKGDKVYLICKK